MRQEKVQYFTDKEEEFLNLLIGIGMKTNVAKLLVFFAGTPSATSREIEHGTDLRQPEVSVAMKYLAERGWIRSYDNPSGNTGRPMKIFELATPITGIMKSIGSEMKEKTDNQFARIRKLRDYHH
jgi:predicted transcriptional regulator